MKLENQVTNLELSKRLEKLGVKQESLFYWFKEKINEAESFLLGIKKWQPTSVDNPTTEVIVPLEKNTYYSSFAIRNCKTYSAYTVAELGEMLPKGYWDERSVNGGFEVGYGQGKPMGKEKIDRYFIVDENEAIARAKMLIYLIENKLLTL